jgi:hypothetical protein
MAPELSLPIMKLPESCLVRTVKTHGLFAVGFDVISRWYKSNAEFW